MPAGHQVRPQKWSNVINLFDDGENSAIWGNYDNGTNRILGMRYNEDYPNQGGNSLWYVEPQIMTRAILLGLLDISTRSPGTGNIPNLIIALQEHR